MLPVLRTTLTLPRNSEEVLPMVSPRQNLLNIRVHLEIPPIGHGLLRMSRNLAWQREDFVLQTTSSSSPSSASTRGFGFRRCVHSPAPPVPDRRPPCQSSPAPSSSRPNLSAQPLRWGRLSGEGLPLRLPSGSSGYPFSKRCYSALATSSVGAGADSTGASQARDAAPTMLPRASPTSELESRVRISST